MKKNYTPAVNAVKASTVNLHNEKIIFKNYPSWFISLCAQLVADGAAAADASDAVEDAVLVLTGRSHRFSINKAMPDLNEKQLYTALRRQAQWRLSHRREYDSRFCEFMEFGDDEGHGPSDFIDVRESPWVAKDFRSSVFKSVRGFLASKGRSDRDIEIYILSEIAGMSAKEISRRFPSVKPNHVDQIRFRIKRLLAAEGRRPGGAFEAYRLSA